MSTPPAPSWPTLAAALAAGLLLGAAWFQCLWWQVRALAGGRRAAAALPLLRFAALAAALIVASRHGAAVLLAVLLGIQIARAPVLRSARHGSPS